MSNTSIPNILSNITAEDACDMIYNRLLTDLQYQEKIIVNEQYMSDVFLDPGENTRYRFEELYSNKNNVPDDEDDYEDVYEAYPALSFIRERVCEQDGVERVINMGLNFMSEYHRYFDCDMPKEETAYGTFIDIINEGGIYAI
tara:strand:- start:558 stop:986 length:429 start_codon:yes stop_codon:yes gene_type:complete